MHETQRDQTRVIHADHEGPVWTEYIKELEGGIRTVRDLVRRDGLRVTDHGSPYENERFRSGYDANGRSVWIDPEDKTQSALETMNLMDKRHPMGQAAPAPMNLEKPTTAQIRATLSHFQADAHHASDEGKLREMLLGQIPKKELTSEEEEELHFRRLMARNKPFF